MDESNRALVRKLIWAVVLKLLALLVIWWLFIAPHRQSVVATDAWNHLVGSAPTISTE